MPERDLPAYLSTLDACQGGATTQAALELLLLTGDGELVFPSPFYSGKLLSDGTLNSALARIGWKGVTTAYGFRTLFSTTANEAGWNRDYIEKQLAHEERNNVRATYNRVVWLEERTKMMQCWDDRIDVLRKEANPLPLKGA